MTELFGCLSVRRPVVCSLALTEAPSETYAAVALPTWRLLAEGAGETEG